MHLGKDLIGSLKNLSGGEIEEYSDMKAHAHEHAMDRMIRKAEALGANVVLDVRVSTACVMGSAVEVLLHRQPANVVDDSRPGGTSCRDSRTSCSTIVVQRTGLPLNGPPSWRRGIRVA
ncbi:MAG: YbjQ family protein [bacterium]|nr:YbjQ family protein [bacterium]